MPEFGAFLRMRKRVARLIKITSRAWIAVVVAAALFGVLAFYCIELTRGDGRIAAIWLPNAFAVALLLRPRHTRREVPLLTAIWLGMAIAAHLAGEAAPNAAALATCNLLEIALALILTRRLCGRHVRMDRAGHLVNFIACAGVAAPAVSATLATLVLGLEGPLSPALWANWFVAHALGLIVLAPVILILLSALAHPRLLQPRELGEWAAVLAACAGVTAALFAQTGLPLLFLTAPAVLVAAFRLGTFGTAISVVAIGIVATALTWHGSGPINMIEGSLAVRLLVLQAFLAATLVMGLPVAAVLNGKRRLGKRIDAQNDHLRLLTATISDAILRFDRNGICTYASPSVAKVLGLPPETFLGRRASDGAHPPDRPAIAAAKVRLASGLSEHERVIFRRITDDPEGRPVLIETDAIVERDPATDAHTGFIVCARDVTERIALERDLSRTRRALAHANDARAAFVDGMGRAIRGRLEHLQVAALQLAHTDLAPEQRRQADAIAASGARLLRMLGAIDELASIEAGRRPMRTVPVGLRQLIAACVSAHRPQAARKGLTLALACDAEVPATLVTDGAHLRQILLTLIDNAVRHTRSGKVAIRASAEDDHIVISVEDSGPGIGSDRRETIFQPFVDPLSGGGFSSMPQLTGTGLSLAIARRLAAMLDGTLAAVGGTDGGACFTLRFPRHLPGARLERGGDSALPSHCARRDRHRRWIEQRSEVLMAVDLALRLGEFEGAAIDDLAALVSGIVGDAVTFGEEELGHRAAALERALRNGDPPETSARLAHALLQAAA